MKAALSLFIKRTNVAVPRENSVFGLVTRHTLFSLALVALIIAPPRSRAATWNVDIVGFAFSPPTVTINVGDTVIWTERDGAGHSTTSDTGIWDSGSLSLNGSFPFTFSAAGTYPYHCTPHPHMMGTVIVQGGANTPPSVSITNPANGAVFTAPATVTIEADASDTDGSVARVEFFDGTTSLGTDTNSPYSVTTNLAVGSHGLAAVAADNMGASSTSAVVTVTVEAVGNVPPMVSITNPTNGAVFTALASVTIDADASDSDGTVAQVEFFDGSTSLGTDANSPYTITTNFAVGSHSLTAVAMDNLGASSTSAVVTITVQAGSNAPPIVSITSPTNNTTFAAPTNVLIEATASDPGGGIMHVEFFNRSTSLGMDDDEPFSLTADLGYGNHVLTAVATDNGGASSTSAVVNVRVATPPIDNPIAERIPKGDITIELKTIADGMVSPLGMAVPDDGSGRMFVYDQIGVVWVVTSNGRSPTPLLDLRARLVNISGSYDERGLLGMVVHPGFRTNGLIYTYTSEPNAGAADFQTVLPEGLTNNHQSVIAEWRLNPSSTNQVDSVTRREIMRIDKPQSNHNGGTMRFGPDGLLYVSLGDGGAADDQGNGHSADGNAQDTTNILGSVIRIDVNGTNSANTQYGVPADNPFVGGPGVDEIYAYGLRNPFSFSFDRGSGLLYLGDVGQNKIEEIDIIYRGSNYGWNIKEGTFFFDPNGAEPGYVTTIPVRPVPPDLVDPIAEYDHDDGTAVIGGYVYRGSQIPNLSTRYVFGDWGVFGSPSGRLYYLDTNSAIKELRIGLDDRPLGLYLKGFGEDAAGELYVFASEPQGPAGIGGIMYKIVSPPASTLAITSSSVTNGTNFQTTWTGGVGPFVLQRKTQLEEPFWMNEVFTPNGNATVPARGRAGFFRVLDSTQQRAVPFTASLSGANERPNPITTDGGGCGLFSLEGNSLTFAISYSGLSGPAAAAHIHGPATATNTATVLINLQPYHTGPFGNNGSFSGTLVLTDLQKAHLMAGLTYVNIHTLANDGGEIRGHIAPVLMQASLLGVYEPVDVNTPARGFGSFTLVGTQLTFNVTYQGFTDAPFAAHIHGPAPVGQNADIMIDLAPFNGGAFGTNGSLSGMVGLTPAQLAAVVDGHAYVNFHTTANQNGEIRGQMMPQSTAVPLTASISGLNERPTPLTNSATGSGIFSLEGNTLAFNIVYTGLSGPAIAAHIHGPATTTNSANVQIDLAPFSVGPLGTSGAFSGSVTLTATQRNMILNGLAYFNVHTSANQDGEARGQIATVLMSAGATGSAERPAAKAVSGSAIGLFALTGTQLDFNVVYKDLTGPAIGAHIHAPATAAQTATIMLDFEPFNGGAYGASGSVSGTATLSPAVLGYMIDGLSYINFHTVTNMPGETRGQIGR